MGSLLTPRWVARHVVALLLVAGCLVLCRWQYLRATSGNVLSWAYTVQWPLFAAFVVYVWGRAVRDVLRPDTPRPRPEPMRPPAPRAGAARGDEADDPQLAAYNDYLAWLAANPDRKPADYPG